MYAVVKKELVHLSTMIIIDGKTLKFREVLLIALTDMFITFLLVNSDQC